MAYSFNCYLKKDISEIKQLTIKRDWMDSNAYKCLPITLANSYGWGVYSLEDVSLIWDGLMPQDEKDLFQNHIKILKGSEKSIKINNSNFTITLRTGLSFETKEDYTLLIGPAPNEFISGLQGFTTLKSTSFYHQEIEAVYKICKANEIITIEAGKIICAILPVLLNELNNSTLKIFSYKELENSFDPDEYKKEMVKIHNAGMWANFYRNATDHLGNILGKHDLRVLKLITTDMRKK